MRRIECAEEVDVKITHEDTGEMFVSIFYKNRCVVFRCARSNEHENPFLDTWNVRMPLPIVKHFYKVNGRLTHNYRHVFNYGFRCYDELIGYIKRFEN